MFIDVIAVQSAFTLGDLLDWLLPLGLILGGFRLIKKNKNKKVRAVGTLSAVAGVSLLLWLVFWQMFAYIIY